MIRKVINTIHKVKIEREGKKHKKNLEHSDIFTTFAIGIGEKTDTDCVPH